jgi:hypothetical protein
MRMSLKLWFSSVLLALLVIAEAVLLANDGLTLRRVVFSILFYSSSSQRCSFCTG